MSTQKRSCPFDVMNVLGDTSNMIPTLKKRCVHGEVTMSSGFHDNKQYMIENTCDMEWHTVDNTNAVMTSNHTNTTGTLYLQKDALPFKKMQNYCPDNVNSWSQNRKLSSVCPRCQAGEPGHIGHINR